MNIDLFNELFNSTKYSKFIQNFINELDNYLKEADKGVKKDMSSVLKQEGVLYQVVEVDTDGVYLQNTINDRIEKEKDIPEELQEELESDFILRYEEGRYRIESELTDDFMNSLVGIKEYREIQEKFLNETNIQEIDENTRYSVLSHDEENSVLCYNNNNTIKVPNALLPYFIYDDTILVYKNGKFEKE